ncbi:MAG: hypothetical protein M3041_12940 [Acidobacteriota bacterium]|nr:hypothetical protein [Acidobacteriota bacterium]
MTSIGETPPPRRKWPRVIGWSCLTIVIVVGVSVFGTLCSVYVSHGAEARKANAKTFAAVSPILPALEAYRKANGRYPKSLCDLHLTLPRSGVGAQLLYTASDNGAEYWLAIFPWYEAGFVMPSDTAREYSSADGKWSEMDVNDTKAKYDNAWGNDCRAETMTSTR